MNMKRTAILMFLFSLFLNQLVYAQDNKATDVQNPVLAIKSKVDNFLGSLDIYSRAINYIRQEKENKKNIVLQPEESTLSFTVDLVLSMLSLWLTILLLVQIKTFFIKSYLWFLLAWNIAWFFELIFFKGAWSFFNVLVIRFEPSYGPVIQEHFPIVLFILAALIYIWLLARVFGFNFFGALGTFLVSHLAYFVIIFIILTVVKVPGAKRWQALFGKSLGIRPSINSYITDSENITTDKNILYLIRIKPFHW
jgi:hypothetical protein